MAEFDKSDRAKLVNELEAVAAEYTADVCSAYQDLLRLQAQHKALQERQEREMALVKAMVADALSKHDIAVVKRDRLLVTIADMINVQ